METYVVEIAGEPVMAFRAEGENEAQELVHGDDSELDGIKTMLLEYGRESGEPVWATYVSERSSLRVALY
jgi:hypothetical protein